MVYFHCNYSTQLVSQEFRIPPPMIPERKLDVGGMSHNPVSDQQLIFPFHSPFQISFTLRYHQLEILLYFILYLREKDKERVRESMSEG